MSNVIKLPLGQKIRGAEHLIYQLTTITPEEAARWLKCNHVNRPVRRRHVEFLAREIKDGHWMLNGAAIVISENEEILDGQHRLLAIIEAGEPIKTIVIYGIDKAAFKTIDTGAVRTGSDALSLWFPDSKKAHQKAVGAAVPWCYRLELGFLGSRAKISNTDTVAYVSAHPSMWRCAEVLEGLPRELRPVSLGMGCAAYEMFQRKDALTADRFMYAFFTGEKLTLECPEAVVRAILQRNARQLSNYPADIKMQMIVKAWNWRRRGHDEVSRQAISIGPNDPSEIKIL
jgi:hypothetical protein